MKENGRQKYLIDVRESDERIGTSKFVDSCSRDLRCTIIRHFLWGVHISRTRSYSTIIVCPLHQIVPCFDATVTPAPGTRDSRMSQRPSSSVSVHGG